MNKKVLARLIIEYRKLSIVLCIALFLGLSQGLSKLTFNPDLETLCSYSSERAHFLLDGNQI